ncbi:MAG: histidine--tRNA ligase [Candidatus Bilamarchaeaceae archaeon]
MKSTPKGMRDFMPEESIIREEVRDRIATIYKKYGFAPMETPALEYFETLSAKAGEEIDKQIFMLKDERLALRFDLTVPLARVAATLERARPFKRYAIGPVWRREEPQKGRFREFWQADADIIGSPSMRAEAELLTIAKEICEEFGFAKPRILLNNRKILDALALKIGFEDKKAETYRLLDKIDKVGKDTVETEVIKLLGQRGKELLDIVSTGKSNDEKLEIVEKNAKEAKEGVSELREILELCNFDIEIDLSLVRGLGYYTGPVYEIKLSDEIGTVIAGGRYDKLLSLYGRGDYATGISVGIERLISLSLEKSEKRKTETKAFIANAKDEFYRNALELAKSIRAAGIPAETDINSRSLSKQLDYANARGIPFVIIIGQQEVSTGMYKIRNMRNGEEKTIKYEELRGFLEEHNG